MLVVRVESLENQLALLLKQGSAPVEVKKPKKEKKSKDDKSKDDKSKDDNSKDDSSDDDVEVKKPKKEKKEKKSKDESSDDDVKKKRGTNGYLVFSSEKRDEIKAKLSVSDEKPKNTEIMKQLAAMWSAMDDTEKAVYNAKAKDINAKLE
jgi:D-alanyl-D-alanine carboxypeptidase